jgi:putative ABC transport system permease protein
MLSVKMALRSIGANKMRAALTMLGIIIGVLALVVLVSLVSSTTDSITSEVSSLGSSLLTVSIRDDHGTPVRLEDLQDWVDAEPSVSGISPYATATATGKYALESGSVTLYGETGDYYEINGQQQIQGRYIKQSDLRSSSRVCVLDETTAEKLVGYADCAGEVIALDGIKYKVIGVVKADDSLISSFLSSMTAYIPYTSLIRLSSTTGTSITDFYIGPSQGYTVTQAETAMKELLLRRFDEDEDAFRISSVNIIEEAMDRVNSALTILLGSIAAISLIVGGIGIMNIMLVTVTERTREIGIRKAIGASHRTILVQFLIEAVVLCMLGCALGIFFSWAILQIVSIIVAGTSLSFHLQGNVVMWSVIFCFLIGVIFGLYPANKAAKMKPIDALHYGG